MAVLTQLATGELGGGGEWGGGGGGGVKGLPKNERQ